MGPAGAADPQFRVNGHIVIIAYKLTPASGQDTYRKFEPLGFVDTHNLHGVGKLGLRISSIQIAFALGQLIEKMEKCADPVVAGAS